VEASFHAIVELVGLELPDGNAAQQRREGLFAQADEDCGKLHKKPA